MTDAGADNGVDLNGGCKYYIKYKIIINIFFKYKI